MLAITSIKTTKNELLKETKDDNIFVGNIFLLSFEYEDSVLIRQI